MQKDKTIERIKSCMSMEFACSTVYHLMAFHFPSENVLWNELASGDEDHAQVFAKAMGFELGNYPDFTVPSEFSLIRKTTDYAVDIKERFLSTKISLKEALEMMKRLQELKNESYHVELLETETEEKVKNVFARIYEADKTNMDLILAVMTKYGL